MASPELTGENATSPELTGETQASPEVLEKAQYLWTLQEKPQHLRSLLEVSGDTAASPEAPEAPETLESAFLLEHKLILLMLGGLCCLARELQLLVSSHK